MFFDELTPDTSAYMIAGYAIFFLITLIYLASLFIRTRNLNEDLNTLKSVQEERQAATAAMPARRKSAQSKAGKAKPSNKKGGRKR